MEKSVLTRAAMPKLMQVRVRQPFSNRSESWSEIRWHTGLHCSAFPKSFCANITQTDA